MPFLLMALRIEPAAALLTSLLIQIAGTASGSFAFVRNKKADVRLALILLIVGLPGLTLGAYIGHRLILSTIIMLLISTTVRSFAVIVCGNGTIGTRCYFPPHRVSISAVHENPTFNYLVHRQWCGAGIPSLGGN